MPTELEWVRLLAEQINAQRAYATPFEQRYRNEYTLPFIAQEFREVYGGKVDRLLTEIKPPRAGVAAITVDALVDRLTILGATVPESSTESSADRLRAVRLVEDAWEDNDLDVMHREAHREALIKGRSFVQVEAGSDGRAVIGVEAPEQMAVHRQSQPPYDVDAALKVSQDEWTGAHRARLWLPGRIVDFEHGIATGTTDVPASVLSAGWRVVSEGPGPVSVPVVEFQSRPRLLAKPMSELEPICTFVDIIDLIEGLMVFAGHFGAVPIRWATGLEPLKDPKDPSKLALGSDGKPIVGFNPRADHMFVNTNPEGKFGQLTPAGLEQFVQWAEHASQRIRAQSSVASTYYSMDLKSHMSAELLKTDEAPMVRRINAMGRDGSFGQGWRRVDRKILEVEAPELAALRVRGRWADPQTRIESVDADTFAKLAPHLGAQVLAEEVLDWSPEMAAKAVANAAVFDPYLIAQADGQRADASALG